MYRLPKFLPEILSVLVLTPYFYILSSNRIIARDEGFYLMASRLIAEGKSLYFDFFYPQMPLLPWIYGTSFELLGSSWQTGRIINLIIAVAIGTLLVNACKNHYGSLKSLIALALYVGSNFVLAWYSVSQTYALSVLFLLASCLFVKRSIVISALMFALAIQTRLFFIGLAPIFLLYIYTVDKKYKQGLKNCFYFCLVGIMASAPTIYYLVKDFDLFLFNNLGYHLERSGHASEKLFGNKIRVSKVALGLVDTVKFSAWQLPLLIYTSLIASIGLLMKKQSVSLAFPILLGLFLLNLIPSPTYVQYFSTLVPFAIFSALGIFKLINNSVLKILLLCTFFYVYLYGYHQDYLRYTKTGQGVIGIGNKTNAEHWSIKNLENITKLQNQYCKANQTILAYWPGYILESNCIPFPGTENHFGVQAAEKLSKDKANKYKIISEANIKKKIIAREIDYILLGKRDLKKRGIVKAIEASGYKLLANEFSIKLYAKES